MDKINLDKYIYANIPENYLKDYLQNGDKEYLIDEYAKIVELDNGTILPLKKSPANDELYGGVIDSSNNFVAGHSKDLENKNIKGACKKAYPITQKTVKRNETVIYAGVMHWHFGHFITESFSRLWYYVENPNTNYKLIFLNLYGTNQVHFQDILESIGLKKEQYEVLDKPTQFDKIIIPEQCFYITSGMYTKQFQNIYDLIISKVKSANIKKVYLSKSKYTTANSKRETYFEEFYRKRGFEIFYPEKLSFLDKVSILSGAEELIVTEGTTASLSIFCKNDVKVTVLCRVYDCFALNDIYKCFGGFHFSTRNIKPCFIDISFNFLPISYTSSTFLYGPTKHWIKYLNTHNIPYEPEEVSFEIHVQPYIFPYLLEWAQRHTHPNFFDTIKNFTLGDVINTISRTFLEYEIDTKMLPERDDVVKMQNYIKKEVEELTGVSFEPNLRQEVSQIIDSMGIQQNIQKFAVQTQNNFKGAQNAVLDLQNKNNILNQKVISLEKQIEELKQKSDKN